MVQHTTSPVSLFDVCNTSHQGGVTLESPAPPRVVSLSTTQPSNCLGSSTTKPRNCVRTDLCSSHSNPAPHVADHMQALSRPSPPVPNPQGPTHSASPCLTASLRAGTELGSSPHVSVGFSRRFECSKSSVCPLHSLTLEQTKRGGARTLVIGCQHLEHVTCGFWA